MASDRKQQGTPCASRPERVHILNCLLYLSWAAIEFRQFAEFAAGRNGIIVNPSLDPDTSLRLRVMLSGKQSHKLLAGI